MKKYTCLFYTLSIGALLSSQPVQAQFLNRMKQKLQDKADKKVDDMLNGSRSNGNSAADEGNTKTKHPRAEEVYTFTPGKTIFYKDDLSAETKGHMASKWKSGGTGSVAQVPDMPGNWLSLSPATTYRLAKPLAMPENFTLEFDLVTRSTAAKDIGALSFGFSMDNSARDYLTLGASNSLASTELHFWNKEIHSSSKETGISSTLNFPLNNYANALIHIAISVQGENMQVYVNRSKVLDTNMFNRKMIKYFYLSAPYDYTAEARVYFSNFVVAT